MTDRKLTVELRNSTAEIARLSNFIARLSRLLGFTPKCRFEVDLITEEVFTNILNHAIRGRGPEKLTRFTFACDRDRLEIQVEDDGPSFNPLAAETSDVHSRLEDRKIGGLGLHLIRSYADGIEYVRTGRKNRLTIIKKIETDTDRPGGCHGNK